MPPDAQAPISVHAHNHPSCGHTQLGLYQYQLLLHQSIAHVFITYLTSLWHCPINTHVVIQYTSIHAVHVDTWCMRTLPAAQSTSAYIRSLTPVPSCIRHNKSFHELVPVPEFDHGIGFVHAHTLMQTHCQQAHALHHLVLNPVLLPYPGASADPGRKAHHHTSQASMYCNSMHHGLLFQHRDCSKHGPTDSTLNAEALQQYSQLSMAPSNY